MLAGESFPWACTAWEASSFSLLIMMLAIEFVFNFKHCFYYLRISYNVFNISSPVLQLLQELRSHHIWQMTLFNLRILYMHSIGSCSSLPLFAPLWCLPHAFSPPPLAHKVMCSLLLHRPAFSGYIQIPTKHFWEAGSVLTEFIIVFCSLCSDFLAFTWLHLLSLSPFIFKQSSKPPKLAR